MTTVYFMWVPTELIHSLLWKPSWHSRTDIVVFCVFSVLLVQVWVACSWCLWVFDVNLKSAQAEHHREGHEPLS